MKQISFNLFLKKTTIIPSKFINDFIGFTNYNNIQEDTFIINFTKVIYWLKIQKHKAQKTLFKSYRLNIDYKLNKIKKFTSKGQNKYNIFITPYAFKHFCMMTKSIVGNDVRNYYIELEKALYKYKDYIINGLQKHIDTLEKGLKPRINPSKGVIYIFKTSNSTNEEPLYKIGRTKKLTTRQTAHQSSLAHNINFLFTIQVDNTIAVEKCIKAFLQQYQYKRYKEIYKCDLNVIKKIINDCSVIGIRYDKNKLNETIKEIKKGGNFYIKFS